MRSRLPRITCWVRPANVSEYRFWEGIQVIGSEEPCSVILALTSNKTNNRRVRYKRSASNKTRETPTLKAVCARYCNNSTTHEYRAQHLYRHHMQKENRLFLAIGLDFFENRTVTSATSFRSRHLLLTRHSTVACSYELSVSTVFWRCKTPLLYEVSGRVSARYT